MLKGILAVVGALVAGLAILIAFQPSSYSVVRSATISASPAVVFAQIDDFHKWEAWSPWAKLDPFMKTTYEGPTSGTGAAYKWVGNDKVGEGAMRITESKPNELVRIKLDFIKPFASTSDIEFTIRPVGSGVVVTWTMRGTNNYLAKLFMFFMGGMDKAVGPDFEKGLRQMKVTAESAPAK